MKDLLLISAFRFEIPFVSLVCRSSRGFHRNILRFVSTDGIISEKESHLCCFHPYTFCYTLKTSWLSLTHASRCRQAHVVFSCDLAWTCRHPGQDWNSMCCVFRCAPPAVTQVLRWAASSKAVPTNTTTGVLWSQVSAALCPSPPLRIWPQSALIYPVQSCVFLQIVCTCFFFFLEVVFQSGSVH